MATNDFLPFAASTGATVLTQPQYAALGALANGFQVGVADEFAVNKTLRQGTFMAALIGEFIRTQTNTNVADDGDLAGKLAQLLSALSAEITTVVGSLPGLAGANGWQKLSGGKIIQWGTGVTTTGLDNLFTFPTTWPVACRSLVVSEANSQGWAGTALQPVFYGPSTITQSNFTLRAVRMVNGTTPTYSGGCGFLYIAIGN